MRKSLPLIEIDGAEFATLDEFFAHFSKRALDGSDRCKNLDAFNDMLRGGYGSPEGGFKLLWRNHALSEARLGYPETVRQLEKRLAQCHPENQTNVQKDLDLARNATGPTVFTWLVEIISIHCAGGSEEDDGIELLLA